MRARPARDDGKGRCKGRWDWAIRCMHDLVPRVGGAPRGKGWQERARGARQGASARGGREVRVQDGREGQGVVEKGRVSKGWWKCAHLAPRVGGSHLDVLLLGRRRRPRPLLGLLVRPVGSALLVVLRPLLALALTCTCTGTCTGQLQAHGHGHGHSYVPWTHA